jgi:glucokinase
MRRTVLAADLGGTNLRIAAVDEEGKFVHRLRMATPASRSRGDIAAAIDDLAAECIETLGHDARPMGFCVTAPAIISAVDGTIFSAPNLPDLDGFDLSGALEQTLGLPVMVENDANAAAVGENWMGASRGVSNSICVTLGTGVGGGLIVDGRLVRGADGTAGEVGHITVEPNGYQCGCGNVGCVEQYASASAITHITSLLNAEYPDSPLNTAGRPSAFDVYSAGKLGDPLALEVFRRVGTYLGIALAGLVNVLNPQVIVIGGGVSAGWDLFIDCTREQIKKRAFRQPGERVKLVRAALGDDAGTLGAAKLAFETYKKA